MPAHICTVSFNGERYSQLSDTLARFLEYGLTLVRKEQINFCYIGTASHDKMIEDAFFNGFTYFKFLYSNISVSVSKLSLTTNVSHAQIEAKIRSQDIIFVGGGETEFMLDTWKKSGFEAILKKLKEKDCLPVIMGLSAGGIFPFNAAISLTADKVEYAALFPDYNWLPGSFCPHSNSEIKAICAFDDGKAYNRKSAFVKAIETKTIQSGYAVPDDCMLHFYGEELVGAFATRENVVPSYVTPEGVREMEVTLLRRETSSHLAKDELRKMKERRKKSINFLNGLSEEKETGPEPRPVYANRCVIS